MPETAAKPTNGKILARIFMRAVLLALAAGVLVAAYTLTLDNEYRATATLLLAPSPINRPEPGRSTEAEKTPATDVSFLMVKPLSVLDYKQLLVNDEIVNQLKEELIRLRREAGKKEKRIRLEDVQKAMRVETRILKQTVYDVVYQPVIELQFTADDPRIAAALAN